MRDRQGFADFASARSAALRRQAYLLTGSSERAARITARALAETGRRWPRLPSAAAAEEHARQVLAGLALRSRGGAPAIAATSLGTALPTEDAGEAVWRALAGLPPRRRAVLVLRYDEGLDDPAVAARLGLAPATVAAEAEAGLATLRSLLRRRGTPETLLPTTLATRHPDPAPGAAASGGAGGGGAVAVAASSAVGARAGSRGRWVVGGGVAAAVVAVAAAVIVPVVRDEPAGASGAVPARQGSGAGELAWPARGALAGDDGVLRAALKAWSDGVPERQRPTGAAVLYAGAPDGVRTVLLQGVDGTGQSWVAEVADGTLRTTEPLGRTVPLLALTGASTRLLAPPDQGSTLRAVDNGTLRTLALDGDGLSEPVTPPAAGLPVAVTTGDLLGSGRIGPGRLTASTGSVELAANTLDLGPAEPTTAWYDDGALLAARLGGPVSVAGLGPARTTTLRIGGQDRRADARAYEAVRSGTRYLATVVRVDGRPACVATVATDPARAPRLVSRCLPAHAAEGIVQAVAAGGVRSVRIRPAGPGKARVVEVTGASGSGLVGVAKVAGLPTGAAAGVARNAAGAIVGRFTLPPAQR